MLNERTIAIMEDNDMAVHDRNKQNGEFWREVEFFSNAGEDVIETVWYDGTNEGFVSAFRQLAEDFDADEHAEMWINNRDSVKGVPDSVRELIDDAEDIKKTLLDVAKQLVSESKKNSSTMDREQFLNYIEENFCISGEARRLIDNILSFVKDNYCDENEQYNVLCALLDNTIGLSDAEIRRVRL